MITRDDVIHNYPEVADLDAERVEPIIETANVGLPDSRFGGNVALADRGRILYVMHMLEKPPVDINAPYVRAQMSLPIKTYRRKPHVWSATEYGKQLMDILGGH